MIQPMIRIHAAPLLTARLLHAAIALALLASPLGPAHVTVAQEPAASIDWQAALAGDQEASALVTQASRNGDVAGLLQALAESEPKAITAPLENFIVDALPGGRLASGLSKDAQKQAMQLATSLEDKRRRVFYELAAIARLSSDLEIAEAARTAMLEVPEGEWPEGFELPAAKEAPPSIDPATLARGKAVYMRPGICNTCHQPNGMGLPGAFPPLAGSSWVDGDTERMVKIVLKGLMGPLEVKGQSFNSVMAPLEMVLTDDSEIADVLTYVNNSWGNTGPEVTSEEVAAIRESVKDRKTPWMVEEILKLHPLREE